MYCPKCGTELPDGAKFCPKCGTATDFSTVPSKQTRVEAHENSNNVPLVNQNNTSMSNEEPRQQNYTPTEAFVPNQISEHDFQESEDVVKPKSNLDDTSNSITSEEGESSQNKSTDTKQNEIVRKLREVFKKRQGKAIIGTTIAIIVCIVAIFVVQYCFQNPSRIKEKGTYTLKLHDSVNFPSINATMTFEDIMVGDINYEDLSATLNFIINIDFSNTREFKAYSKWLNNFEVNDTTVGYRAGDFYGSNSIFIDAENWVDPLDHCRYMVSYHTKYTDDKYVLGCIINDGLSIALDYDYSFWDLDGIDKQDAIDYNQKKIDSDYGITSVDWQDNANTLDYVEGDIYKMTGEIISGGKYFGSLTDKYYLIFDAAYAFPGVDVHCYFDAYEWDKVPTFDIGDIITVYGCYEYNILGWNFDACSIESPAGTYILPDTPGTNDISENSAAQTANPVMSPQPSNELPNSNTNDFPPSFTPIEGYSDHLGKYIDEYGRILEVSVGTGEGISYFINIYANQADAINNASPLLTASHGTLEYRNGYMIIAFEDSSGNGLYFERDNFIEDNYTLYVHGSPYVDGCDMEPSLDTTFYMMEQYIDPMT